MRISCKPEGIAKTSRRTGGGVDSMRRRTMVRIVTRRNKIHLTFWMLRRTRRRWKRLERLAIRRGRIGRANRARSSKRRQPHTSWARLRA